MAETSAQKVAMRQLLEGMTAEGQLYQKLADGRLLCYACGHQCRIRPGRCGVCRVRFNRDGKLMVPSGYVAALACDPIEKKPFYHAFPGRQALSFGMLGCDFHCAYCQNWLTSQVLQDDRAVAEVHRIRPGQMVDLAVRYHAPVISSTYNEPLITSEWAVEILRPARQRGLVGAFVSNGNATKSVLEYLRPYVQLFKVDLKSFDDRQYRRLGGQLENVKRTIRQLHAMGFWVEVVTLLVPDYNDDPEQLRQMAGFLASISPDLPWHVTAFHADYKMTDRPATRPEQLLAAAEVGRAAGLRYVYAGNRPGQVGGGESTCCPACGAVCIERHGFTVLANHLKQGCCPRCGRPIPGFWSADCYIPQENQGPPQWLE